MATSWLHRTWESWTSGHVRAAQVADAEALRRTKSTTPLTWRDRQERLTPRVEHTPSGNGYHTVSSRLQVGLWDTCLKCDGSGVLGQSVAFCAVCAAWWKRDKLAALVVSSWRGKWKRLPCRHSIDALRYTNPTCQNCGGDGGFWHTIPLRDFADTLEALRRP